MKKVLEGVFGIIVVAVGFAIIPTIWDLLTTGPYSSIRNLVWCGIAFFGIRFVWELIEFVYWIYKNRK